MSDELLNGNLQSAIDEAFAIDKQIADLRERLHVLIGDLQSAKRPHESGILIGASEHLKDSYYRKLGGMLQDMQK